MAEIRRVRADDWEALRDLRLRALDDAPLAFSTTVAEARLRDEAWWREAARRGAEDNDWATFVAADAESLVGMASGHYPGEQHHPIDDAELPSLMQMWVAPEIRRRGVGRDLVDAVDRWAAARGAPLLRLGVTQSEIGSVAFYEALGFRDTGRRDTSVPRLGPVIKMERRCRT